MNGREGGGERETERQEKRAKRKKRQTSCKSNHTDSLYPNPALPAGSLYLYDT